MKKATVAVVTIASLAGMAGLASAIPTTQPPGLTISEMAKTGAGGATVSAAAQNLGGNPQTNSQTSLNSTVNSVPEASSVLLLGAGLLMLAVWSRRMAPRLTD
jgi:hypothetical protein